MTEILLFCEDVIYKTMTAMILYRGEKDKLLCDSRHKLLFYINVLHVLTFLFDFRNTFLGDQYHYYLLYYIFVDSLKI